MQHGGYLIAAMFLRLSWQRHLVASGQTSFSSLIDDIEKNDQNDSICFGKTSTFAKYFKQTKWFV